MAMDKKKAAVARNTAASADLRTEIEKMTRLVVFARECLEKEMIGTGLAYKQEALGKSAAKDLQALATSLEKLTGIRIKYDQHLRKEADNLTPEEEQDALIEFFATLDVAARRKFMRRLVDRHNEMIVGTMYHDVTISVSPSVLKDDA